MVKNEERGAAKVEIQAPVQTAKNSENIFADFDFSALKIDLEEMLKSGVHFGHQKSKRNPRMETYIFGTRKNINILDLEKTREKLEEALEFVKELKAAGKKILFVGTKKQLHDVVSGAAKTCQMPYVVDRWLGGTFTNFRVIRNRAKYLKDGQAKMEKGEFSMYTKLERSKKAEELEKLERKMGGIKDMLELPGALLVTDISEDLVAVKEARKVGIPVIALADTNCNPDLADYPIPANDDAISSVKLILAHICKAVMEQEEKPAVKEDKPAAKKEEK